MKKSYLFILLFFPLWGFGQQNNGSVFEDVSFSVGILNINSEASDFGPAIVNSELWYSAFSEKNIRKINQGNTKGVFYDLFIAPINPDGTVSAGVVPITDLSEGFHEGPVSFCEKTGELFVTLSNAENPEVKTVWIKQDVNTKLRLVVARFENSKWVIKEELPFNNPSYSVGQPSVSVTGDTLYFTSDIPDFGQGGTDIYMSVRQQGKWSSPINLGPTINTVQNEMFPFFNSDGTLIFASNGQKDGKGGLDLYYSCLKGQVFSSPQNLTELNTGYDDFGLVLSHNGQTGYFTSNRTGGKGDDDIYKINIKKVFTILKGIVLDEYKSEIIPGALVVMNDCSGTKIAGTKSGDDGKFEFKAPIGKCLRLTASAIGCEETTKDVGTSSYVELKLKCGCNLELILLDIENSKPLKGSVRFCDGKEITSQGDGKILRTINCGLNCLVTAEATGYLNTSREIILEGKTKEKLVRDTIYLYKAEVNKTFELENIYYDYDKWNILPESGIELDKLVQILNDNKNLKVELGSHTDSRGSDSYNKWLSQKRSDSAVGYILQKGIDPSRIVAKGYGETLLINRCKNGIKCTDEEHRKNRRTEFKILSL